MNGRITIHTQLSENWQQNAHSILDLSINWFLSKPYGVGSLIYNLNYTQDIAFSNKLVSFIIAIEKTQIRRNDSESILQGSLTNIIRSIYSSDEYIVHGNYCYSQPIIPRLP